MKKTIISLVAIILVLSLAAGILLWPEREIVPEIRPLAGKATVLAQALYPVAAAYPDESRYQTDQQGWKEDFEAWRKANRERDDLATRAADTDAFLVKTMGEFLTGTENRVYSPLNIYFALAMLAETTDGNSRQQILDLLGSSNVEQLRQQANALWQAHYRDDGVVTSRLAGSLWLNQQVPVNQQPLDILAQQYYASSYSGEPGTQAFDRALQEWINTQTGGLLADSVKDIQIDGETVLALATTIYYRARWDGRFLESNTTPDTFYSLQGEVTCDFMHATRRGNYYWGQQFGAIQLTLQEGGGMWLFLPDEGKTTQDLLADPQVHQLLWGREYADCKELLINLSLPKFDVSAQTTLNDGLKNLGVTDIFSPATGDFSPLGTQLPLAVSQALHQARVQIDEEGCTATAVTVIQEAGSSMPPKDEVDFDLDRPFLFAITSEYGAPLFVGTVQNP